MVGARGYPPHRLLSLEEKVEIIKEYERTKNRSHLSLLFYCHPGQISRTLLHKIEIVADYKRIQAAGQVRKKRSACRVLQAVGTILNEFVQRCRYYPIQLSDDFLQEKAKEIAEILNLRSFRGHNYWLKTFKHRFKLLDVNWDTWNFPYDEQSERRTLHMETIVEELRESMGSVMIPHPSKLSEEEYEQEVQELIANSTPYPGYKPPEGGAMHRKRYNNNNNNNNSDNGWHSVSNSDDDVEMTSYDDNSYDFDPTDLLTIENGPNEQATDDPMNIDSYQTALNYFRPVEQFVLGKKEEHIMHMARQVVKVLEKAAESEGYQVNGFPSVLNEIQIEGYRDAAEYLKPLEEFVLNREYVRAVGLINQLEIILNDAGN